MRRNPLQTRLPLEIIVLQSVTSKIILSIWDLILSRSNQITLKHRSLEKSSMKFLVVKHNNKIMKLDASVKKNKVTKIHM